MKRGFQIILCNDRNFNSWDELTCVIVSESYGKIADLAIWVVCWEYTVKGKSWSSFLAHKEQTICVNCQDWNEETRPPTRDRFENYEFCEFFRLDFQVLTSNFNFGHQYSLIT